MREAPLLHVPDIFEAAVYALVTERCSQAYRHDLNGVLQALQSGLELVCRSAVKPLTNAAMTDKAAALTQRAIANLQRTLQTYLRQTVPGTDPPTRVDLGLLLQEIVQFVRNDLLSKSVVVEHAVAPELQVTTQADRLRTYLLGLTITLIDALPSASKILFCADRVGQFARVQLRSTLHYGSILDPALLVQGHEPNLNHHEFVLAVAAQWVIAAGGRVEPPSAAADSALSIYLPFESPAGKSS